MKFSSKICMGCAGKRKQSMGAAEAWAVGPRPLLAGPLLLGQERLPASGPDQDGRIAVTRKNKTFFS